MKDVKYHDFEHTLYHDIIPLGISEGAEFIKASKRIDYLFAGEYGYCITVLDEVFKDKEYLKEVYANPDFIPTFLALADNHPPLYYNRLYILYRFKGCPHYNFIYRTLLTLALAKQKTSFIALQKHSEDKHECLLRNPDLFDWTMVTL
jgi:hypothetical protein